MEMEKQLTEQHIYELRSSGLNDETIKMSGIYSATSEEVINLGFTHNSSAMVIPYADNSVRIKPDVPFLNTSGKACYIYKSSFFKYFRKACCNYYSFSK